MKTKRIAYQQAASAAIATFFRRLIILSLANAAMLLWFRPTH